MKGAERRRRRKDQKHGEVKGVEKRYADGGLNRRWHVQCGRGASEEKERWRDREPRGE
jgi:hypothetical protein